MSVSETPKKPPRPRLIVALLVLILIGVIYIAFTVNEIKNIEQSRINTSTQQVH